MSNPTGKKVERVLFRRGRVLESVNEDRATKQELVERLDIPRSTLDDIVRELAEVGFVEYVDGNWQSTTVGRCAWEIHERYSDQITGLAEATPVLEEAVVDTIDCAFLDGCTVYDNGRSLPDRSVTEFTERMSDADKIQGLVPQALAGYIPAVHDEVVGENPTETEMVFDPELFREVVDLYPERIQKALDQEHVQLYKAPIPVSYGLWIADEEHTGIIVYADTGVRGVIVNDTQSALDWAVETYDRIREQTEQIQ